jgi:methionyl-tRNA formyltransferase
VRTAYLGTSTFAAAVLRELARSDHAPALVVTRPDAPKGRGRRLAPPPVAEEARALGIEVFQPEDVNAEESVARIAEAAPEVVLLCAFGAIIREPLLTRFGAIRNVHPSLLPRWRGAAPVERAIMAGDEKTGVTIMAVGEGLDDGPVYVSAPEEIRPEDDYASLTARLEPLSAELLIRAIEEQPEPVAQNEDGVTYAEKITAADRTLDPSRPAAELERVVRALTPHIGARIALPGGEMLGVRRARVAEAGAEGALVVPTADGALELLEVQPPGGRPMDAAAYLRGRAAR